MASTINPTFSSNLFTMIGSPGFMPPPPKGPINDDSSSGQSMNTSPIFNFHFNPSGGLGTPTAQGGPTSLGGGRMPSGFMPPPPIQGIGGDPMMQRPPGGPMRVPPPVRTLPGLGFKPPPQRMPPGRMPPPTDYQPTLYPIDGPMPGWAGYLQWLNLMGGRMPPPPIQGI